jgi:hypothetical protein
MRKILFCIPHGGLNDSLYQIQLCYQYAQEHDRDLYIDGSKSGFLDSFENYFIVPEGVFLKKIDFLNPPFDCYPKFLSEDIINYPIYFEQNKQNFAHSPTGALLTFDFSKSYDENILIHEQCGGGLQSVKAFEWMKLKEEIRIWVAEKINKLGEYDAIHVRNTDYQTNYPAFFRKINKKLREKIVLCTDDWQCQNYAKSFWGERLTIVTKIPNTHGQRLHQNSEIDRFETNVNAIADLFILACSKNLYYGKVRIQSDGLHSFRLRKFIKNLIYLQSKVSISGYSQLAKSLHERKELIQNTIYVN